MLCRKQMAAVKRKLADQDQAMHAFGPCTMLVRNSSNRLWASLGSVHSSRSTSQDCTQCAIMSMGAAVYCNPRKDLARADQGGHSVECHCKHAKPAKSRQQFRKA